MSLSRDWWEAAWLEMVTVKSRSEHPVIMVPLMALPYG